MKRLTKNDEHGGYYSDYRGAEKQPEIQKLGQLEDIEEALGIDLITLFKTLKQGRIWIKKKDQIISSCNYGLCLPGIGYYLICKDNGYWLPVKDYGKTWALTKEELE